MPAKYKAPAANLDASYRVLSGGISTPAGTAWKGAIVTGADLGNVARVKALLEKKAIEAVDD